MAKRRQGRKTMESRATVNCVRNGGGLEGGWQNSNYRFERCDGSDVLVVLDEVANRMFQKMANDAIYKSLGRMRLLDGRAKSSSRKKRAGVKP